ncbi:hypothetical protein ACFU8X_20575 [Brevibacillus porteri]|uniref:hypothetical protein n=1 Tax=Brevibacillus porteri TaxID=2126350 RepID=UPI00370B3AC6
MKLIISEEGYRLEMGYEIGFGPPSFKTLTNIIQAFISEDLTVLHPYAERDRERLTMKKQLKDHLLDSFHYDVLFDEAEVQANHIKKIIFSHYSKERNLADSAEQKNKLLIEFRNSKLEDIDFSLKDKIKDYLYSTNIRLSIDDCDIDTQEFIKKRIKFYNQEWLLDYEKPVDLKGIYWIEVVSTEDILTWFEINDWWFKCAIVNQDEVVRNYQYFLDYTEEHGTVFDGMVLKIREKKKGLFLRSVLPNLQKILKVDIEIAYN